MTRSPSEPRLQAHPWVAPGFQPGRRRATTIGVGRPRPRLETWGYPRVSLKGRISLIQPPPPGPRRRQRPASLRLHGVRELQPGARDQPPHRLERAGLRALTNRVAPLGLAPLGLSTGTPVLGLQAILSQDPHHRPERIAKSPAPFVHAASKAARLALYQSYAWFVAAFRDAAEKLRRGDRTACFPAGSFPPALPFVAG